MPSDDTRERYNPAVIEPKWQKIWEERQTFRAERHAGKEKLYVLDMFPYPSGSGLHVGHPEGYTATDIVARHARMLGKDVLHPMGWDAFGLPAEQHAIRTGQHPAKTTHENIQTFRRQLKSLGFSYDWSREVDTTDKGYVHWTQWIFLQLYKKGLAFQSEVPVNWCPELGTVLANEEVVDGKSDIGGHPVERLPLRQWMLKITAYADRLDTDLAGLDWPDTKGKQHAWIGRSEGADIDFEVIPEVGPNGSPAKKITVFTTRADTLAGATYVVLAPEHPLVPLLATGPHKAEVLAYVEAARAKSDFDRSDAARTKTGVPLDARAINPINGHKLPVWVADYVIGTYGTGAVMAVPAHDERDHAFARAYELPIVAVVAPTDGHPIDVREEAFTDDGVAMGARTGSSGPLRSSSEIVGRHEKIVIPNGMPSAEVRKKTVAWLEAVGKGRARVTYHLRDWVFSRQRYWGEPIPVYFPVEVAANVDPREEGAKFAVRYDEPIPVDESELPLELPELEDFRPGNDPAGPLARAKDWRFFQKNGRWFARETNTMPQWAGSCWYYLRYLDPKDEREPWTKKAYADWMPVDLYVGGSEHAVLHLLYARFWHKVLFDIGAVAGPEPFMKLVHQGVILGEDGQKMAKSRGNVINPDDVVKTHGADSLRLYEMFMGPLEQMKPWQTSGIEGVRRFLDRVWNVGTGERGDGPYDNETRRLVHKTVKKVGDDIVAMRFNTAISAMMILVRHLGGLPAVPAEAVRTLVLLVSAFAPHLGEELWQRLGNTTSLAYEPWPTYDPALVKDDVVEIGVQVNGKLRGTIRIGVTATADEAKAVALEEANVAAHVTGKNVKKLVYVPGKILNFIVT
jgi:leucyl-tRNA synthetase